MERESYIFCNLVVVYMSIAAASYTLFFKECWEHKFETELNYRRPAGVVKPCDQSVHERMKNRPPAALPTVPPAAPAYSSTSNR